MKRWLLLSIPLVGLASITVWAQAVTGAPTGQEPGVIVRGPDPRDSALNIDGFTETLRLSPLTHPKAGPRASSPALKSAPLNPATSSPLSTKAAEPARTGPAPDDPADSSEDPDVSSNDSGVELVEPAQVTSPAVEPTDNSTSSSQLDGKGGLTGNNGLSGTNGRSGSSNE
ncbi:hypothetical protein QFZ23_003718 [Arthrobacter globiformis]|uniref:hypothetical protein n=1 Tax=Arthrobacter globiformis TaxID=1665 RepID=UPI00277EA276|nr:hypothetical protein [Arthrobacter globiformis]MDQ1059817.1 hypothetical protein [Arthrobacter globiformis]